MNRTPLAPDRATSRSGASRTSRLHPLHEQEHEHGRPPCHWRAALLLCAASAMAAPCWADAEHTSAVSTTGATGSALAAPLAASAHLDFRITVLPALSLRSDARGQLQASSNSGPLLVQGAALAVMPSASGSPSASRAATHRGPLAALAGQAEPDATGRARITIASP